MIPLLTYSLTNYQFGSKNIGVELRHSLGEEISQLILGAYMTEMDNARRDILTNGAAVNTNVFGLLVKNKICCNLDGTRVVYIERSETNKKTPSSRRRCCSQTASLLAQDMDLHSASANDLETVVYFMYFRDMEDLSTNMHQQVVHLRASGQQSKSASAQALMERSRSKKVHSQGFVKYSKVYRHC